MPGRNPIDQSNQKWCCGGWATWKRWGLITVCVTSRNETSEQNWTVNSKTLTLGRTCTGDNVTYVIGLEWLIECLCFCTLCFDVVLCSVVLCHRKQLLWKQLLLTCRLSWFLFNSWCKMNNCWPILFKIQTPTLQPLFQLTNMWC